MNKIASTRFHRTRILACLFVVGAIAGGYYWWRASRPPPPLEVSLWYWHQPFRISPEERASLNAVGVRKLFVRAATFRKDGENIHPVMRQNWAGRADGLDIHLVFNFDYSIVHQFAGLSNETLKAAILTEVQAEREQAARAGLHVTGVQFDFDCPTSRLPKYALLLHRVRESLPPPSLSLSITALPTWYGNPTIGSVLREVDFAAPQYYEASVSRNLQDYSTVSRLALAERGMQAAGRWGAPFYAGIPAYGHALVYNAGGGLVGTYHDKGLLQAARYPAFRLVNSYPSDPNGKPATPQTYIGEDIYDLLALTDASDGQGKGCHILYEIPTPEVIVQHLALMKAKRPQNCLGVILFRYPEAGETSALPLSTLAAAVQGAPLRPALRVQFHARTAPWELFETGKSAQRPPVDLTITVTNTGNCNTYISPDAVKIILALNHAGMDDIAVRGCDGVETYVNREGEAEISASSLRASPFRSNVLVFHRLNLAAGETVSLATIRIPADGATQVLGSWSARCPGGFVTVRGDIAPFTFGKHGKDN